MASPVSASASTPSTTAPDGAQPEAAAATSSATTRGSAAGAPTTSATSGTSATTTTGAATTVKAPGSGTPFCVTIGEMEDLSLSGIVVNAGNAKVVLTKIYELFQQLKREAPAAIAADVTVLADASERQYEIMARNDFDGDKVKADPEFAAVSAASQDPSVAAATPRFGAYALAECGVDLKAFTTPTGAAGG